MEGSLKRSWGVSDKMKMKNSADYVRDASLIEFLEEYGTPCDSCPLSAECKGIVENCPSWRLFLEE